MQKYNIYFTDFFDVDPDVLEEYGAFNISLINDLPLFIDPFLLFNSQNEDYQKIHSDMIKYLVFLRDNTSGEPTRGMLKAWYLFSEIPETWLGFSQTGNKGRGLGMDFAKELYQGLSTIFSSFGKETVTRSSHMEKFCLISPKVGRDKISDFTTNFAKKYLLEYTQNFAEKYLRKNQGDYFNIPRVEFNYDTQTWADGRYYLPCYNGRYVILTPKDMLKRDETFINRLDMLDHIESIVNSVSDDVLRFQLDNYLQSVLSHRKKEPTKDEKRALASAIIKKFPDLIDYYIKHKEETGDEAISISKQDVLSVQEFFIKNARQFADLLNEDGLYGTIPSAYDEAFKRAEYLKDVIEKHDGYRFFYLDGNAVKRESDLQLMYRLVWYGTKFDVNREVNNGRGPVDYKISYGKENSAIVEFKLASNSKLKKNLQHQVEIYKQASETEKAIKVIMFFTEGEQKRVISILNELNCIGDDSIVLIDARSDNKVSASNA